MSRTIRRLFAGGLFVLLLTGCWDRRELNELGILSGIAIDKVGQQYQVSVQVVVPDEVSSRARKGSAPVTMYKATAPTLFEAFRKLTETSPRKIYTAHIRVLVLSEPIAKDGIAKVLDILVRNPESRIDYFVMVARKTSAEKVLKVLTPLDNIPAEALYHSLDTASKEWAPITKVTVDKLTDQLMSKGINPVLPGITISENGRSDNKAEDIDPPVKLNYSGLAAFNNDKLIGWLSTNEGKGYNYIRNNVQSTVGNIKCPDGKMISLEIIHSHTDVKSFMEDVNPHIEVQLKMDVNIGEVTCDIDLTEPKTVEKLQKEAERELETLMKKSVAVMQKKYKVDIFGFGQVIYNSNPKLWKSMEKDWDERFTDLKVLYKTKVNIRDIGMINHTVESKMKEK
ncbi:Ger(x)C family spore germination protein [Paenibacillus sp. WQ 127069]|uniref:Ger(X)C family spore germination protein n=1 Tax=Paenibacillus baimaensis TaxID=2982185 RepID=A0ABT2UNH3_9BACL|nr:Ger(x)C family spore germination protein [Paenibacillus sp. WQ 127069]MCU6795636.1 Ger(x)C family spore germination protein [Paenibacillus sp. WQ 127069]